MASQLIPPAFSDDRDTVSSGMLVEACVVLFLAAFAFAWSSAAVATRNELQAALASAKQSGATSRRNVLLVFAHPDDESMFFTPLLEGLRGRHNIFLLCLSNGNFSGLGKVRARELVDAAAFFGVLAPNVDVVDHPALRDGMQEQWPPELVATLVRARISQWNVDVVFTFDDNGVSGHPNHIAVHRGMRLLAAERNGTCPIYTLRTRPTWSKYVSAMSLLPHAISTSHSNTAQGNIVVVVAPAKSLHSLWAMMRHRSQLVWFRYLFVWFSSYTFINEFDKLQN